MKVDIFQYVRHAWAPLEKFSVVRGQHLFSEYEGKEQSSKICVFIRKNIFSRDGYVTSPACARADMIVVNVW